MASVAEDIVQRIVIVGSGDTASALKAIGDAGKKAFDALESSLGHTNLVLGGFVAAAAGVTTALLAWTRSSTNAARELGGIAKVAGTSVEEISAFKSVIASLGGNTDGLDTAFKRLALRVSQEWPKIQKQIAESADNIKKNIISVQEATLNLEKSQAEQRGGGQVDPALQAQFAARQRILDVQKSQISLNEAQRKQQEDMTHDIVNNMKILQNAIGGAEKLPQVITNGFKQTQMSARDAMDALIAVTSNISKLPANFKSVGDAGKKIIEPDTMSLLRNFAKLMNTDILGAAEKVQLTMLLLGRNIDGSLVAAAAKGEKSLDELIKKQKELGIQTSDTDVKLSGGFAASFGRLSDVISKTSQKISVQVFAKPFTDAFDAVSDGIEGLLNKFNKFYEELEKQKGPGNVTYFDMLKKAIEDFANDPDPLGIGKLFHTPVPDAMGPLVQQIREFIKNINWGDVWDGLVTSMVNSFKEGLSNMEMAWGANIETLKTKWTEFVTFVKSSWESIKSFFGFGSGAATPAEGKAAGGIVTGPGSGTSDSVPIMASRGEGIVRADGSNLMDIVRHFTRGFSLGGIVSAIDIPHFDTGGIVAAGGGSSRTPVILDFGGGHTFATSATDNVAQGLQKFSSIRQMRSAGVKNWWVK